MPEIIHPFDNDRLKTRKVRQALADAGQLPTRKSQQPTFLRSTKTNEQLINAALAGEPIVLLDSPRRDALTINMAFEGLSVVGGPEAAASGNFSSQQFFLSGEEISVTNFLSTGYDPAHHTEDGMIGIGSTTYAPQLVPAIVALLEAACTVVFDATTLATDANQKAYLLVDAAEYLTAQIGGDDLFYLDNTVSTSATSFGVALPLAPGRYKMAFTRTNGNISVSVNGGAVFTNSADDLAPLGTAVIGVKWAGTVIHEFTIYPPQDDIDLPTLSAL